ncbi:MAG TPA: DUF1127 domain-containing protein [Geminicoccaceae bacterium]|nr:DUF1127 domain-containing protein [Geminicoccaceae bacterium]
MSPRHARRKLRIDHVSTTKSIAMPMRIEGIFRRWCERRRRKAAIAELQGLSDRTLKDIGLTRGEIVAAAEGRVYRGQPPRLEPEPCAPPARAETIDAAALRGFVERARQQRAEFVARLLRRGFERMLRPRGQADSPTLRAKADAPRERGSCRSGGVLITREPSR